MTFIFDENLSPALADGMKAFGEDVVYISPTFTRGTLDPDFLPDIGARGWSLFTRDKRMRRVDEEVALWRQHRVGVFLLGGKDLPHCAMIQQVVRAWPNIKKLDRTTGRPFGFVVRPGGGKIERQYL